MRLVSLLIIAAAVSVLAVSLNHRRLPPAPERRVEVQSQGPTIERLERLSHLVTSRVQVADVLIAQGEGCRGAWLIRGDSLIAVNLSQAAIIEKDEKAKRATIQLSPPELLQARVDHERTRTWAVDQMNWLPWTAHQDRLRDDVMQQAQRLVAQVAGSRENIEQAKQAAETIICGFYEQVGWQVEARWKEPAATATKGE